MRSRGYNQAAELAQALARSGGFPLGLDVLRRSRETGAQSDLPPESRAANVRGAFQARGVAGRRVLLVDDVFTTGATLGAAAEALVAAGAQSVQAVTFARALGPLGAA
jgi:predicted amidophosphoribosyltransferase